MSEAESVYYSLTAPDNDALAKLQRSLRADPAGGEFLKREEASLMTYGSAPQPLFSRVPIPYRLIPLNARAGLLARMYARSERRLGNTVKPYWPIDRELDFEREQRWTVVAAASGVQLRRPLWPDGKSAALTVTHDIDTADELRGIEHFRSVERTIGIPSAFGFVPKLSWPSQAFAEDLVSDGCEVYLHDVPHDGKLPYKSRAEIRSAFENVFERSPWAHAHMHGFRAGQMLTSPTLREVVAEFFEYDLSIPDTERGGPYGYAAGCGTVFPFHVGNLLEIPLTMPQDVYLWHVHRLTSDLAVATWRTKLDYIIDVGGVAVLNVHPAWMNPNQPEEWTAYSSFLSNAAVDDRLWITTPSKVAEWVRGKR